jgi:dynein regulatory complex protein 1
VVVSRRAIEREREYWQRLSHAVSERVMRVWGRLEGQLGSYHKLLVARGEGLVAVSRLQAENEGLRELLNQYLGAKVNEQLQVPPLTVL